MNRSRVIKVGGSLLDLPDLATRIQTWLESLPRRKNVLVMGGGNFCNEQRRLHDRFHLPESFSHDLCLDLMSVTARLLGQLLDLPTVDSLDAMAEVEGNCVLDCRSWISTQTSIPQSWEITADSIAALVAQELNAELVLLKSVDAWDSVDPYFATASAGLEVELVNLRERVHHRAHEES